MASIKLYLDTRTVDKNGANSLKIAVNHNCKSAYILLNVRLKSEHWDSRAQRITSQHTQHRALNTFISSMLARCYSAMQQIQQTSGLRALSAVELRDKINSILNNDDNAEKQDTKKTLLCVFDEILADKLKSKPTLNSYAIVKKHLCDFDSDAIKRTLDGVTRDYLLQFYGYLMQRVCQNTAYYYMTKLASVMNRAIDDGRTVNYPFRRLTFKKLETRKRALTLMQMRSLATAILPEKLARARDMFMLMFYLLGINIGDLCALREVGADNFVEFYRKKTKRLYRIEVMSEASEIINRYKCSTNDNLLNLLQVGHNKENVNAVLNYQLKAACARITDTVMPKDVTTYWARHTWATIAASLDIPKETISAALGHSMGSRMTSVYIDFDMRKVSVANRKVIDFLLYNKK